MQGTKIHLQGRGVSVLGMTEAVDKSSLNLKIDQ